MSGTIDTGRAETPDQLTIETPEQVAIRLPLAGVGSRFLAVLADSLIQLLGYAVLVLALVLILSAAPRVAGAVVARVGDKWLEAGLIAVVFLLHWGYYTLFEAFWNGQTPGKKLCRLRVIRDSGRQITLFESMTRNFLRIIDELPGFYAVGVITMWCNRQNKRLGDLAAGTLVVHERSAETPLWTGGAPRTITAQVFAESPAPAPIAPLPVDLPADAVARLSADDLNVIDHFFARAIDIDIPRRVQLAERLARQMTAKMGTGMPAGVIPERVLESIARILRGIQR
ncbi:MAG TPA: RDD family protein [Acidobacteriaceae bacterium]|nr:RDD family protein [Acidobacteriaceae bacterium]